VLHIALAERKVKWDALSSTQQGLINTGEKGDSSTFEYIVKKMLPSATGTKFTQVLDKGDSITFPLMIWTPDPSWLYPDPSGSTGDMVVVAFLQDELSKEVHQAKISTLIPDPPTITGLENPFSFEDVITYPNPADRQLNIQFPNPLEKDVPIMLFDQMGRITHNTKAVKGTQSKTLETDAVSSGMYIVQMDLGDGKISRRKVIITHKE